MTEEAKIYSVSELNGIVSSMLETRLGKVAITGEISNFSHASSGHMYLSLKDQGSQLSCAMFKGNNSRLRFVPNNGRQVIAHGKLSLYVPSGRYQLIISRMLPAGEGALQQKFIELKQKLADEGLFDPEIKKPLPLFPKQLGVITSPTGAAIKDILNVLERRYPIMRVKIYPVLVQGDTSASQIVSAIARANLDNDCDLLLLSRGGGSIEDLWSFNEEIVARAIRSSELPIVSGVGHEIDETIADYTADMRAPTPSAAAELITPDSQELLGNFYAFERALQDLMQRQLQQYHQTLDFIEKRLQQKHPHNILLTQQETISLIKKRLLQAQKTILREKAAELSNQSTTLKHLQPSNQIQQLKERCSDLRRRLLQAQKSGLQTLVAKTQIIEKGLESLNPSATLERGYAILSDENGNIIDSIKKTKAGATVTSQLQDGSIVADVTTVKSATK